MECRANKQIGTIGCNLARGGRVTSSWTQPLADLFADPRACRNITLHEHHECTGTDGGWVGQTYSGAFAATIVSWSVQRARYKYKHLYHTCKIVIVHRVVNDSRGVSGFVQRSERGSRGVRFPVRLESGGGTRVPVPSSFSISIVK